MNIKKDNDEGYEDLSKELDVMGGSDVLLSEEYGILNKRQLEFGKTWDYPVFTPVYFYLSISSISASIIFHALSPLFVLSAGTFGVINAFIFFARGMHVDLFDHHLRFIEDEGYKFVKPPTFWRAMNPLRFFKKTVLQSSVKEEDGELSIITYRGSFYSMCEEVTSYHSDLKVFNDSLDQLEAKGR